MDIKIVILLFLVLIIPEETFGFSKSSILLRAKIKNIKIFVSDNSRVSREANQQVKYLTGNFLEYDAGLALGKVQIDNIRSVAPAKNEFEYNASFDLLWPKEKPLPNNLSVILPDFGSKSGQETFLREYEKSCSYKINGQIGSFWSYLRPSKKHCLLFERAGQDGITSRYLIDLKHKRPLLKPGFQSSQLLKDGVFKATIVLGRVLKNYKEGPSQIDLNHLREFFINFSGQVVLDRTSSLGKNKDIYKEEIVFLKNGIKYNVNLFLVNDFGEEVSKEVNLTTKNLDFFSYNGHAGMGENILSIGKNLNLDKNKYSIMFLNSCITYGYFYYGDFQKFKNTDFIVNSIQNHFGTFYHSNKLFFENLVRKNNSYDYILSNLPIKQRSLVLTNERSLQLYNI